MTAITLVPRSGRGLLNLIRAQLRATGQTVLNVYESFARAQAAAALAERLEHEHDPRARAALEACIRACVLDSPSPRGRQANEI